MCADDDDDDDNNKHYANGTGRNDAVIRTSETIVATFSTSKD